MNIISRAVLSVARWPYWRPLLARLPLPMLALAASYGVYRFALLFVPPWVAIVQAAAFELVYIGLAVVELPPEQMRRARRISVGAVVVSIAYNTLDGLFHRRPGMLIDTPLWGDIALAILHGAPLAWLAWLVADLLLHNPGPSAYAHNATMSSAPRLPEPIKGGRASEYSVEQLVSALPAGETFGRDLVLSTLGCSEATATRLLQEGIAAGVLDRAGRGVYRLTGGVLDLGNRESASVDV